MEKLNREQCVAASIEAIKNHRYHVLVAFDIKDGADLENKYNIRVIVADDDGTEATTMSVAMSAIGETLMRMYAPGLLEKISHEQNN